MPFTLEKPDGTLRHIAMLRPVKVADSEDDTAEVREGRYAITFELADK
jgi:hypothetical protein